MTRLLLISSLLLILIAACQPEQDKVHDPYEKDVDTLLQKMTLEEKIGQMTQICFSTITLDGSKSLELNVDQFREAITEHHVGSFLSGSDNKSRWYTFIRDIQKIAVEETRLGIPLIIGIDHVHGANYVDEGTILPHNITVSCSFDKDLMYQAGKLTARETAPLGLNWNFAPVLDVGVNQYWPRFYETFGEDPLVTAELGEAFIRGSETTIKDKNYKMAACAKHFIGYSDPRYGWDRAPAWIPRQQLWEFYVPPFKKAFDAGVKTVMVNSGALNGQAVHASKDFLTDLLQEQLGFDGVILTDIKDISKLVDMHHVAKDVKEATRMSVDAGIDMSMACNSFEFNQIMKELVDSGLVSEARIDQSVRKILKLKHQLGLFENPYPDSSMLDQIGSDEHYAMAREAAESSVVLLKNQGALPFDDEDKVLLAGFAADSKKMLTGPWTYEWMGAEDERHPDSMNTIYTAMTDMMGEDRVQLFPWGESINEETQDRFKKMSEEVDAIVLTVGEEPYSEFNGNISDLTMDEKHTRWIELAIETGKPVVLILVEGRPRLFTKYEKDLDGVLFAGYPGMGGGDALVSIMTGEVNPSGKLSFTYPKHVHHTLNYHHYSSEYNVYWRNDQEPYSLYDFGDGMGYADISYTNLKLSDSVLRGSNDSLVASVEIKNEGAMEADEVVLWYMSDEVASWVRPVKMLKAFDKISLPAGLRKKVKFTIHSSDIAFPDKEGQLLFEEGYHTVQVGGMTKKFKYTP